MKNDKKEMLSQLINRTNEDGFYSNWNLKLDGVYGKIKSYHENDFEIYLVIENESKLESIEKEHWKIEAQQVLEVSNVFSPIYLPYIKLSILEEHPLLWKFMHDTLECELSGICENHHEFTSRLHWLYEEQTGGFIAWKRDFHELPNLIKGKRQVPILLNMKTYNFVKGLLDEFGLSIEIKDILSGENKGYLNKPDAKVLIFGNPDVSPNDYNLGQPYVIADNFTAEKMEKENAR